MMQKQAENPVGKFIMSMLGRTPEVLETLGKWSYIAAAGLGGATGYGIARLTSPTSISNTSDKELEEEALRTEIDVTQRRLMALEERRKRQKKEQLAAKPYDRFIV